MLPVRTSATHFYRGASARRNGYARCQPSMSLGSRMGGCRNMTVRRSITAPISPTARGPFRIFGISAPDDLSLHRRRTTWWDLDVRLVFLQFVKRVFVNLDLAVALHL